MSAEGTNSPSPPPDTLAWITQKRPPRAATGSPDSRRLQRMVAASSAAVRAVPDRLFGVALGPVLNGATHVRPAALDDDDKVRVVAGEVHIERRCFECIARTATSDAQAELEAAMYVLHELAHLPQGIGAYAVVKALRTINEDTLLDLDLAADHFAALAVALMDGPHDLIGLKDLQARSLCGYPVGGGHSSAARLRKAARVVSLRADVLLRRAGVLHPEAGYVVAAFGPATGALAMFERGCGAPRVIGHSALDARDRRALAAAADPVDDALAAIARVDAILEHALCADRLAA